METDHSLTDSRGRLATCPPGELGSRAESSGLGKLGSSSRQASMAAERRPSYRDRDRTAPGESGKYWRAPRSQSHGGGNFSVPLWEKKFCTDACAIPWVNPDEHVDPELVADLERSRRAVPKMDIAAADCWDSFIFTDKPVPATGWGDGETSNTTGQKCSVNWDNHEEQLIEVHCRQSSVNWDNYGPDNYASQPAQTFVQQSSGNWDMYVEQRGQTSSWGAPILPSTSNWDMNDESLHAWNGDHCWGSAAIQTDSDNHGDNYDVSDSQGRSYGHWRRRNNESGRRSSRNRDRGGSISSKVMKSKYQADEHNSSSNGWRHCRVRDNTPYSYEHPGYTNQSLAM